VTNHADLSRDTTANPVSLCAAPRLGPQLAAAFPTLTVLDRPEAAGPHDRLLVLYPGPVPAMAAALAAGGGLPTVLADWTAQATALLDFLRRNRRRVLLTEEAAFLADPAAILALAALRPPAKGALAPEPPPDPLLALLAAEMLRRDPRAHALAGELEASATASQAGGTEVDLEAARHLHLQTAETAHLQAESAARLQAELEEAQAEQEAVLRQLLNAQAEQERLQARIHQLDQGLQSSEAQLRELALQAEQRRALEAERAALASSLAKLRAELATRDAALAERDAILAERNAALEAVNREAVTLRSARVQGDHDLGLLTKRLARAEQDLANRRNEVQKLRSSTSYRITAPMRWVKRKLSGKE